MSTNHEKLIQLIHELTELDDPRIQINIAIGKTLMDWLEQGNAKESPNPDVSQSGISVSRDLRNTLNRVPGRRQ